MFQMLSRDEKRCVAQALAATLLADVARFGMIDKDTRSAANPIVVKLLEDDCVRWASVAERLVSISDSDAFIASKAGKRALTSVPHIRPNLRDIDLISDCLCTNKVLTHSTSRTISCLEMRAQRCSRGRSASTRR